MSTRRLPSSSGAKSLTVSLRLLALALVITPMTIPLQPAAQAGEVYKVAEAETLAGYGQGSSSCTNNSDPEPNSRVQPVPETGSPVISATTYTARYANPNDPADVMTTTSTIRASSAATIAGARPASIRMRFTGKVTAAASKPNGFSACIIKASATVRSTWSFSLDTAMWVTITSNKKGPTFSEAFIAHDDGPYIDLYGTDIDGGGTVTLLLAPGVYTGGLEARVGRYVWSTGSGSASGQIVMTFARPGSASDEPAGTARRLVLMPKTRSCQVPHLTASLTTKRKSIKQIRKVVYMVNNRRAITLRGRQIRPGRTVRLPLAAHSAAAVSAVVTMKSGARRTVRARYLACTI